MKETRTDEELMLAYQAGEFFAFNELYLRHSGRVLSYLKRRLRRPEEAEDVFQQVYAKLHRSRHTYDPAFAFGHWLFVITRTVLLDHWGKEKRKVDRPGVEPLDEGAIPAHAAGSGSVEGLDLLQGLPADQKQVVTWRILDELSYQEIAKRLDRSQEGVRQMLSRALRRVRKSIIASPVISEAGKAGGK